jgi:hypothetical protein
MAIVPSDRDELEWANPANWHWVNVIYVSRRDGRAFVPRRPYRRSAREMSRVATTPNFGNWRAYLPVVLTVVVLFLLDGLAEYISR